jgi:hypothetical protein
MTMMMMIMLRWLLLVLLLLVMVVVVVVVVVLLLLPAGCAVAWPVCQGPLGRPIDSPEMTHAADNNTALAPNKKTKKKKTGGEADPELLRGRVG